MALAESLTRFYYKNGNQCLNYMYKLVHVLFPTQKLTGFVDIFYTLVDSGYLG